MQLADTSNQLMITKTSGNYCWQQTFCGSFEHITSISVDESNTLLIEVLLIVPTNRSATGL